MNGAARSLEWIIEKRFEVPFFQRPYVWKEDNWEELWNAILESKDEEMPFIGSFILQKMENRPSGTYLVIDGQQRLTTLSILIKSYLDNAKDIAADDPEIESSFNLLKNRIMESKTSGMRTTFEPRVKPSSLDRKDFLQVMNFESPTPLETINEQSSNMLRGYKFFSSKILELTREQKVQLGSKFLTQSLFYIAIELDPNDDEQKIFDSVNRLGMELRNSDIIKNNLFQRIKEISGQNDDVLDLYNENWHNVFYQTTETRKYWESEVNLGRLKTITLDAFLKDFATIKQIYIPSETGGIDDLSKAFKDYASRLTKAELIAFIKEIGSYANDYYELFHTSALETALEWKDTLKVTLLLMKANDTTTFNPYILKLFHEKPDNIDSLLKNLQKFFIRRMIYGQSVKNYNKICLTLLQDNNDPFDYLMNYSAKGEDISLTYSAFPPNLLRAPSDKFGRLIIFLVELIKRKQAGEQYFSTLISFSKFSLEHIMPQKWQANWSSVPCYSRNGEMIEDLNELASIRNIEIWSIGNMMLLTHSLNSKIGNADFAVKINGNGTKRGRGIKDFVGGCITSKQIVDIYETNKKWDESFIYEREKDIFETLNAEYEFVPDPSKLLIQVIKSNDQNQNFVNPDDPKSFEGVTVGKLAYSLFSYLLRNSKLSPETIELLKNKESSNELFPKTYYPVLSLDRELSMTENGRYRYYSTPVIVNGERYFITTEWFDEDRQKIVNFFLSHNSI